MNSDIVSRDYFLGESDNCFKDWLFPIYKSWYIFMVFTFRKLETYFTRSQSRWYVFRWYSLEKDVSRIDFFVSESYSLGEKYRRTNSQCTYQQSFQLQHDTFFNFSYLQGSMGSFWRNCGRKYRETLVKWKYIMKEKELTQARWRSVVYIFPSVHALSVYRF